MTLLNRVIGTSDLCAWQPARGITWIQTRLPMHTRRLAQRRDGRLVVRGVAGGYLRTYEFRRPLSWAKVLIARYTLPVAGANARLCRPNRPQPHFVVAAGTK